MADYRKVFGRIVTDAEGAVGGVSVNVYQPGTTTAITLKANKAGQRPRLIRLILTLTVSGHSSQTQMLFLEWTTKLTSCSLRVG